MDKLDERPRNEWFAWLAGLIDGEGSFNIKLIKKGTLISYSCAFSLGFRADDLPILQEIELIMGTGNIYADNTGRYNPVYKWLVASRSDCRLLAETLKLYPLRTKKRFDFIIWERALALWETSKAGYNAHKSSNGGNKALWSEMEKLRNQLIKCRSYPADFSDLDF